MFEIDGKSLVKNWKNRNEEGIPLQRGKKNGIVKLYSSRCCDKYSTLKKGRFFETSYWKLGVKKIKALANQLAEV